MLELFLGRPRKNPPTYIDHVNPDGSRGGKVAEAATVGRDVTVPRTATVLPGANVPDGTKIEEGTLWTAEVGPINFDARAGQKRHRSGSALIIS